MVFFVLTAKSTRFTFSTSPCRSRFTHPARKEAPRVSASGLRSISARPRGPEQWSARPFVFARIAAKPASLAPVLGTRSPPVSPGCNARRPVPRNVLTDTTLLDCPARSARSRGSTRGYTRPCWQRPVRHSLERRPGVVAVATLAQDGERTTGTRERRTQ